MAAVGAPAPSSGMATKKPAAIPITVPRTRRKPRTRVSPREVVLTKIHHVAPTAQYQRCPESNLARRPRRRPAPAVAWIACRVVMRARPLPLRRGGHGGTAGSRRS
ncbi:hypothetical protein SALBM311S_01980 [Streptomyces alboniger]